MNSILLMKAARSLGLNAHDHNKFAYECVVDFPQRHVASASPCNLASWIVFHGIPSPNKWRPTAFTEWYISCASDAERKAYAAKLAFLDVQQAKALFDPQRGANGASLPVSPLEVYTVVKHFTETGVVDWDRQYTPTLLDRYAGLVERIAEKILPAKR